MAFFKRVLDHLLNQVLVDSLANSRWFQRFAVWSHKAASELKEKGGSGSECYERPHFTPQSLKQGRTAQPSLTRI